MSDPAEDEDQQLTLDVDTEADALLAWVAEDIKSAPKQIFALGKFLFGVSSGSVGVLISISKFSGNVVWDATEWTALAGFVFSGALALWLTMPRVHKSDGNFILTEAHGKMVRLTKNLMISWGLFWTAAVVLAGVGLLT